MKSLVAIAILFLVASCQARFPSLGGLTDIEDTDSADFLAILEMARGYAMKLSDSQFEPKDSRYHMFSYSKVYVRFAHIKGRPLTSRAAQQGYLMNNLDITPHSESRKVLFTAGEVHVGSPSIVRSLKSSNVQAGQHSKPTREPKKAYVENKEKKKKTLGGHFPCIRTE
ncbi:hypothetical protein HDE_01523 [Halotydeus destructor]|nr:hypothetical protein HDE_01523 [Halotydeus destructor]